MLGAAISSAEARLVYDHIHAVAGWAAGAHTPAVSVTDRGLAGWSGAAATSFSDAADAVARAQTADNGTIDAVVSGLNTVLGAVDQSSLEQLSRAELYEPSARNWMARQGLTDAVVEEMAKAQSTTVAQLHTEFRTADESHWRSTVLDRLAEIVGAQVRAAEALATEVLSHEALLLNGHTSALVGFTPVYLASVAADTRLRDAVLAALRDEAGDAAGGFDDLSAALTEPLLHQPEAKAGFTLGSLLGGWRPWQLYQDWVAVRRPAVATAHTVNLARNIAKGGTLAQILGIVPYTAATSEARTVGYFERAVAGDLVPYLTARGQVNLLRNRWAPELGGGKFGKVLLPLDILTIVASGFGVVGNINRHEYAEAAEDGLNGTAAALNLAGTYSEGPGTALHLAALLLYGASWTLDKRTTIADHLLRGGRTEGEEFDRILARWVDPVAPPMRTVSTAPRTFDPVPLPGDGLDRWRTLSPDQYVAVANSTAPGITNPAQAAVRAAGASGRTYTDAHPAATTPTRDQVVDMYIDRSVAASVTGG